MDVEVVEGDGEVHHELMNIDETNNNQEKKDFLQKRKQAYKYEFLIAKKHAEESDDEEDAERIQNETLKNTLYNKFQSHLEK